MTKKERNKFLKTLKALNEIFYEGKLHKYKLTPAMVHEIADSYNNIVAGEEIETIVKEVKDFFEKMGFCVEEKGIGWMIN